MIHDEPLPAADRREAARSRIDSLKAKLLGLQDATESVRSRAPAYVLFALISPAYVMFQILTRGRYVLGGEMFAEMSTNYFPAAQSPSLVVRLLSTDAGYIPLPQRLLGAIGDALGLPMAAVPYYYTFSALVLSGLIVGVVVLPVFRNVIPSDLLRFLVAASLLLVLDFESRTYLNFTYLAVLPFVFLAALAVCAPQAAPRWIWFAPVFAVSKPTVLAAVPAFVLAGISARGRFRPVAIATAIAGSLQVIRLVVSAQTEVTPLQTGPNPGSSNLIATATTYTVGFIGRTLLSPSAPNDRTFLIASGWLLLAGLLAVVALTRSRSGAVVVASVSLIAFGMLLNTATFAGVYTGDGAFLDVSVLDRRNIPVLAGAFAALAGVLATTTTSPPIRAGMLRLLSRLGIRPASGHWAAVVRAAGPLLFAIWFSSTGWLPYAAVVNRPAPVSVAEVLQWERQTPALADPTAVVCIPVAPLGWPVSGRGCRTLAAMGPFAPVAFTAVERVAPAGRKGADDLERSTTAYRQVLSVPPEVTNGRFGALSVVVQPAAADPPVSGALLLRTRDGRSYELPAEARLPLSGGVLTFGDQPTHLTRDVVAAQIVFDSQVDIGMTPSADGSPTVATLWMGQ